MWLGIFLTVFAVTSLLVACTVLSPPYYGDLTRIGLLSEAAFGWRTPQPLVPRGLLQSAEISDADILVIGDSFSRGLIWQSELVRAGSRVATVDWQDTGPLCGDFSTWLQRHRFRGKLVIIESVERELDSRLRAGESCHAMKRGITKIATPQASPPTLPPTQLNWSESLFTGFFTAVNTFQAEHSHSELIFATDTLYPLRLKAVPDGCRFFSHRACEKGLFLTRETDQPALSKQMLRKMLSFNQANPDAAIVWMLIPNKSTVYLGSANAVAIGPSITRESIGPDLFSLLVESRFSVRDLYAPNDTHLSTAGYVLVGHEMAKEASALTSIPRGRQTAGTR